MTSIFLSHSHPDKDFVRQLATALEESGVRVWVDEAEIEVGDSLFEKIEVAIDEMDYLGVVLSPASVQSEWVKREVRQALGEEIHNKRVKVLPILLANCIVPGFLRERKYADFRISADFASGVAALLRRLAGPVPVPSDSEQQDEPQWTLQAVRAGFDFGVLEERDGQLALTPEFCAAVHAVCTEGLLKEPMEFLDEGFAIMTVKAMLRTHPGGPLLEGAIEPLASDLSPRVLDYAFDLARTYQLIEESNDAFQLASDLKLEFARRMVLSEEAGKPLQNRSDHIEPLIELCRYKILAANAGDPTHAYLCAAFVYYSLQSLGYFDSDRDSEPEEAV